MDNGFTGALGCAIIAAILIGSPGLLFFYIIISAFLKN